MIIGYQPGGPVRSVRRSPTSRSRASTATRLRYAGAVGTGFSERVAAALRERLDRIATPRCILPGLKVAGAVWVDPSVQAEIAYRGTTTAGELRHASFKGLVD